MAKINGPLFSMDASGKFGKALVFTKWKGRNVVRQLITPSNPKSTMQEIARNIMRVIGAMQHFANATLTEVATRQGTDKAMLIDAAPPGFAWNGNLAKIVVGAGAVNYTAALNANDANVANDAAWDAAADALDPPMPDVAQFEEDGVVSTPLTGGQVFFRYTYALYLMGLADVPGAVPPVYA